jgi:hypothetical protein
VRRPGRTPELLGSNRASPAGSSAAVTTPCGARAALGGRPHGRGSRVPGVGMSTRRTGAAFPSRGRCSARGRRAAGVRAARPSTPGVVVPRLSWVPGRTAPRVASWARRRRCCRLRTCRSSPRGAARSLRLWSVHPFRSIFSQPRVCPCSLGWRAVLLTSPLRLTPLSSTRRGSRPPSHGLSPWPWLLEPSSHRGVSG